MTMIFKPGRWLLPAAGFILSACAMLRPHGPSQTIVVEARQNGAPLTGATCQLINERGRWTVSSTPGSATIERGTGNLVAVCEKGQLAPGFLTVKTGMAPIPTPGPYSRPAPPPPAYARYPSRLTVELGENRTIAAPTP